MYRKFLLFFLPVRSYVLESSLSSAELILNLHGVIQPDKMYFIFPEKTEKPYSGKFGTNRFVAIKNNNFHWQRQIKVRGFFYLLNGKIYVRLILSNPFSVVNFIVLGILYFIFLVFGIHPFPGFLLNALMWLIPVFLTYVITNLSFQSVYKKEKLRFFKLFKGRRLMEKEMRAVGV